MRGGLRHAPATHESNQCQLKTCRILPHKNQGLYLPGMFCKKRSRSHPIYRTGTEYQPQIQEQKYVSPYPLVLKTRMRDQAFLRITVFLVEKQATSVQSVYLNPQKILFPAEFINVFLGYSKLYGKNDASKPKSFRRGT